MATNWPRDLCSAVSVAQTGTIALSIPVPHPLTRRAIPHVSACKERFTQVGKAYRISSRCGFEQKFEE